MVSLKTIAEKCGVSTATVSKALNDQRDISEETKNRVKQTAQTLGYFPMQRPERLRRTVHIYRGTLRGGSRKRPDP